MSAFNSGLGINLPPLEGDTLAASNNSDSPGWFGKFPALGDFASRRLDTPYTNAWEAWLKEALFTTRAQLGNEWQAAYLGAPIWNFALFPGVVGSSAWAGSLMSSVDAVGRYFPLLVCAQVHYPRALLAEIRSGGHWYNRIQQVMVSVLSPQATLSGFEQALEICPFPLHANALESSGSELSEALTQASYGHVGVAQIATSIGKALSLLEVERSLTQFASHSLWWAPQQSGHTKSMLCEGMPRPEVYSQMLVVT
jgi:type VI secretion system protein ImpM